MICLIWCEDKKHGIAKGGVIPWDVPSDRAIFKKVTNGKIVVMGRKTWESLPKKPLPNRINYILTKDDSFKADLPNTYVIHNIDPILELSRNGNDVYIIGGKQVYELFFKYANGLIITKLNEDFDCDTIMEYDLGKFEQKKSMTIHDNKGTDYVLEAWNRKPLWK